MLAAHLIEKVSTKLGRSGIRIDDGFMQTIEAHDWPGNIRELENAIERAIIRAGADNVLTADLLDVQCARPEIETVATNVKEIKSLRDVEKNMIIDAMAFYEGNIQKAAAKLGIGRNTLYRKMKEYEIS